MPKLWVMRDWFIEVDENGYYKGYLGEGMLGVVVRLQAVDGAARAWKLPRLMADTLEQNAYIERLLADESAVVRKVHSEQNRAALLPSADMAAHGVFKGPRQFSVRPSEKGEQEQQDCVFFVQFPKGSRSPRFCLVKYKDQSTKNEREASGRQELDGENKFHKQNGINQNPTVFPPSIRDEIKEIITRDVWDALVRPGGIGFNEPSFCARSQFAKLSVNSGTGISNIIAVNSLEQAIEQREPLDVWYTGLSSILWNWAPTSLQQAIAGAHLVNWALKEHCQLWERMLNSLRTLHTLGYIHADIRPANIFSNPKLAGQCHPDEYFLGDYGSFGKNENSTTSDSSATGNTQLGAEVGRTRSSPFYSSERRAGVERETSDVAIIVPDPTAQQFRIWLGWKNKTLQTGDSLHPELIALLRDADCMETERTVVSDGLRAGDRIRLKDEVYTVKKVGLIKSDDARLIGGLLCVCGVNFDRIIHDRLAVRSKEKIDKNTPIRIVPIPSFVELKQWSAATDLYSIGALMLYTIYSAQRQKPMVDSATSSSPDPNAQTLVNIDAEFRELMMVLESIPYLRVLWNDLDKLYKIIREGRRAAQLSGARIGEIGAKYEDLFKELRVDASDQSDDNLLNIVSNITRSVPNIRTILEFFDWNMVKFVLYLHFVLRCIHRAEHIGRAESAAAGLPFCNDRTDPATGDGPAERAFVAFDEFLEAINDANLNDVRLKGETAPEFDVRSEFAVKMEIQQLLTERRQLLEIAGRTRQFPFQTELFEKLRSLTVKTGPHQPLTP
jgi:serine/threonine protein kinase